MRKLKLFPKTFLYTIGIMGVIVLLVHSLMYVMLPTFYLNQKQEETSMKANELMEMLQDVNEEAALGIASQYAVQHNVNIVLEIDGEMYRYQGFTPMDVYIEPTATEDLTRSSNRGNESLQVKMPESASSYQVILERGTIQHADGQSYHLQLMLNIQPVDEAKQMTLKILPYSILISLIISLIAAFVFSKVMTRPIKNILQVTKEMESLKKDSYCIVESEDEIGMLAKNVNSLYDTLWHTIDSLEQKVQDISEVEKEKVEFLRAASHELKTPLTSLSILLENMTYNIGKYSDRDMYLKQAGDMVKESTEMVQHILETSKLQTISKEETKEKLDVREILLEVMAIYHVLAKAKGVSLHIQLEETCYCEMNREALKKVFSNLLANAIQYTDDGKRIKVLLTDRQVVIENECTGLSEDVLSNIFKAFYRPDFSRNKQDGGSGLGLYIVKSILTAAHLDFTFTPSELGMIFRITFNQMKE